MLRGTSLGPCALLAVTAAVGAPSNGQCNALSPAQMFLDPTTVVDSDGYPITAVTSPASVDFQNGGDPVINLRVAPPSMLLAQDFYSVNIDYDACIDPGTGVGTVRFHSDGSYAVRVERASGSKTIELFDVGVESFGSCFRAGPCKEFTLPQPQKGFHGADTNGGYFQNECTVLGIDDLVSQFCAAAGAGTLDLVLVGHGCEGTLTVNGEPVSKSPAHAANLAKLCALQGKASTATLLQCSTGHGPVGAAFLDTLSTKLGGAPVTGYTGDVLTWTRNGILRWASWGIPVTVRCPPTEVCPGSGVNPVMLNDVGGDPTLSPKAGDPSEPFQVSLNCGMASGPGLYTIHLRARKLSTPLMTSFGELLCAGPIYGKFSGTHNQDLVATPSITVPPNPGFAGLSVCVQGLCGNGPGLGGVLSNALGHTVGF